MGRVRRWLLFVSILAIAVSECSARGTQEPEFLRIETVGEKTVRLDLTTTPETYDPNIYWIPGQELVRVVQVAYDPDAYLSADLYYPPSTDLGGLDLISLPVVIFPIGFSAERMDTYGQRTPKESPFYIGWATLFAMQGAVAIVYDPNVLDEGFHRMFSYLESNQQALGLDLTRIGIWASSGHGKFASLALSYPEIAPHLRAVLFVHSDARPATIPHGDIAFYLVYSPDGSRWERTGAALARRLEIQGVEVTVDASAPYKNFAESDRTPESVEIVRRSLIWMRERLGAVPAYAE